ncbi:MAG TPA: transglutaminase family protein [Gammaproteobacteria bacterium]
MFSSPIQLAVEHRMCYRFDRPINLRPHVIRLHPAPHCRTPVLAYALKVKPDGHVIDWLQDQFANYLARLVFAEPVTDFTVDVELSVEIDAIEPFDFLPAESAQHYPFDYEPRLKSRLAPYLQTAEDRRLLSKWLGGMDFNRYATVDLLAAINQQVQDDVSYCVRMEPGVQSCRQTLQLKSGSCRDSAWLLVQIFRHLGLAARFVSGYLLQPDTDHAAGIEDRVDLHAWTEVYVPGPGWVGLDSTSGFFTGAGHVPLACAPIPIAAAPMSGNIGKCGVMVEFYSSATRIN